MENTIQQMKENTVFVGNKPILNYVLAVVMQFNSGANHHFSRPIAERPLLSYPQISLITPPSATQTRHPTNHHSVAPAPTQIISTPAARTQPRHRLPHA